MKIAFDDIKGLLEDPFFELRILGKEAVRQRIMPLCNYGMVPDNFRFVDWVPEDDREIIQYSFHDTLIGRVLLASTPKGLCFLGFACGDDELKTRGDFVRRFPKQSMEEHTSESQKLAAAYCNGNHELIIPLHLRGTNFQLGVWKHLVRIPEGCLSTYGFLATAPGAAQAVGAAVGANPVSYIIPCHRIVKRDGSIDGYHWGTDIKKLLLAYELQP